MVKKSEQILGMSPRPAILANRFKHSDDELRALSKSSHVAVVALTQTEVKFSAKAVSSS